MKIKPVNGKVDAPHLLKQLEREEKRYLKMLDSGKNTGVVLEIIHEQLENIAKMRKKLNLNSNE